MNFSVNTPEVKSRQRHSTVQTFEMLLSLVLNRKTSSFQSNLVYLTLCELYYELKYRILGKKSLMKGMGV